MKRKFILPIVTLLLMLVSSCTVNAPWRETTFFDSRLYGDWELIEVNGRPINRYNADFFYFNGNGGGMYYYYYYGRPYEERMTYYCTTSNGPSNPNQISIFFEATPNLTNIDYYFDNSANFLYLEWYDYQYRDWTTYTYRRVYNFNW